MDGPDEMNSEVRAALRHDPLLRPTSVTTVCSSGTDEDADGFQDCRTGVARITIELSGM
jgi:hypothetical protein